MKKISFVSSSVLFSLVLSLLITGCGNEKNSELDKPKDKMESHVTQSEDKDSQMKEDGDDIVESEEEQKREIVLYYADEETGYMTTKNVQIKDEKDIWRELQKAGIIKDNCELLNFSVNDSNQTVDIDVNHATGEWIRSMGTSGELVVAGCIINTYLDAYNCTKAKVTEEGEALVTSHGANYGDYSGKIIL